MTTNALTEANLRAAMRAIGKPSAIEYATCGDCRTRLPTYRLLLAPERLGSTWLCEPCYTEAFA